MIDSATEIGLSEIGSVRETNDTAEIGDFKPQVQGDCRDQPGQRAHSGDARQRHHQRDRGSHGRRSSRARPR